MHVKALIKIILIKVSHKVYTAGLHWLGIGHEFIIFPRTVQTIEFSKDHTANSDLVSSRT